MPHTDPKKRKAVKRANYVRNREAILARMARNRLKKKPKPVVVPIVFTDEQVKAQLEFIDRG